MDAIDAAIEEALRRQREGGAAASACKARQDTASQRQGAAGASTAAGHQAALRDAAAKQAVDPFSPEAILRAANEDDDLYDPYSDYMDALARSTYEEPEEDPWR